MSASRAKALQALAEPIVAASDCELEDVVIRPAGRRLLVRLVVDHRDGALTLDLVASISRDVARALDDSTVLGQAPYVLEVTSPGVDRPLRTARHWHRAIGRIVLVTPTEGEPLEGRVLEADDTRATLDVAGQPRVVEFADVAHAVVQVEFTRIDDVELDEIELDEVEPDGAYPDTRPDDAPEPHDEPDPHAQEG